MKMIAVAAVLALSAVPAAAQESMAQAAERQKKGRTGQTKVITEDDLRNNRSKGYSPTSVDGAPEKPAASASPAAGAAGAPGAKPAAKSDEELRAEKRTEIDAKIKEWNNFIAETRRAMEQAQTELNDLGGATFGNRRAGLQKIIDEGTQHIQEAQQSIADLQEQARRSGLPVSR